MNKPTAVSFFCGAGGMDLGFIQAGFYVKASWDWDKYAVQSYHENIGNHVDLMDIKEMTYDDIPAADVWLFGFPCQDLSVAGKQKGIYEGERSSMFFHVMRLLQETREIEPENLPSIIMAENVKGLKPYLGVLEDEYKKQGYVMKKQLFNSKYWGVPQNRERYFVVGVREDLPQTFEFPEEDQSYVPKLSSILETEVDEKYYISNEKAAKIIEQAMLRLETLGEVHPCITPDRVDKRQNGRRAKENEAEMFTLTAQDLHGIIVLGRLEQPGHDERKRVYDPEGIAPAVKACGGGDHQPKILVMGNTNPSGKGMNGNVFHEEGLSPTLTTNKGEGIKVMQQYRVRKLTPREYARLQGFPEDYRLVVSNSQLYKQFGNAVTVPKAKGTALKIKEYLEGLQ